MTFFFKFLCLLFLHIRQYLPLPLLTTTDRYVLHLRSVLGADFVHGSEQDGNGHGTHVARIAGGAGYGVAKEANLIAVRMLDRLVSGVWVVGGV